MRVERNSVLDASGPAANGISLTATNDSLIADNLVSESAGLGLLVAGLRNHVERNVLTQSGS